MSALGAGIVCLLFGFALGRLGRVFDQVDYQNGYMVGWLAAHLDNPALGYGSLPPETMIAALSRLQVAKDAEGHLPSQGPSLEALIADLHRLRQSNESHAH